MYFANPWGLLGLLAVPAILAIHFFHRRYPPLVIAGAHLWGIETEVQTMGRRWDRLPLSASLFLELLAAIFLSLLLSQPRLGILGNATHLVVVLDDSASMQAAAPNGKSFRDLAFEKLRERTADLPGGSRVTVILSGPLPQTLAGPAVPWAVAESRLADWQPSLPQHRFGPAWDRAAQFADKSGEMLFLTDHLPPESADIPGPLEVVAVGEALRNVAITTAEWTLDPSTNASRAYLRIANFSGATTLVDVEGRAKQREVFHRSVRVPAGGEEPLEVDIPKGTGLLTVKISAPADGLKLDNTVTLIEPQPRQVKVSVELPEESPALKVVREGLSILPAVKIVPPAESDLKIATANPLPGSERDLWWFGIGPIDRSEAAREKAIDVRGPYILERRHPLVRGLMPGTLIWGGVQATPDMITPLISCDRTALLAQLEGTFTTGFLLNIDFERSQLQDSEDWPILLSNLVELRRDDLPGLHQWNYRLNETIEFRARRVRPETSARGICCWSETARPGRWCGGRKTAWKSNPSTGPGFMNSKPARRCWTGSR